MIFRTVQFRFLKDFIPSGPPFYLIILALICSFSPDSYSQTHPSFEVRHKQMETRKAIKSTHSTSSFPSSYGEAYAGNQHYEYIGTFDFTVDEENAEVEIQVNVVITTGEENEYGDGEYVNVWIDWEGDGKFENNDQVMDQVQFAKAVGFKGVLHYSTTVQYPEDLEITDETWIRASLGYGHDPAPSDYWTFGSSITKPIELGEAELQGLKVWVSPLEGGLKSAPETSATKQSYYTGTLPDGAVIDPYHGYLAKKNWIYGDLFKPLVYKANEPWIAGDGNKWKGKGINYEFTANFPGEKINIIARLMESTGESGKEDDKELWKRTMAIRNGKNIGQIPGEQIMDLQPGSYYIKWEREVPLKEGMFESIINSIRGKNRISLEFSFKIERRPYYISDKTVCEQESEFEEHIGVSNWRNTLYSVGTNVGGAAAGATLGVILTAAYVAFYSTPVGWAATGLALLIGTVSSATVGHLGSELPNAFGWQRGDIAYHYKWNMEKFAWDGPAYKATNIKLTWHLLDYYRRGADIGFAYYWESNQGNFAHDIYLNNKDYLDFGCLTGVGYIFKNTLPNYKAWSNLWYFNSYPASSSIKLAGYGPVAPRIKRPKYGDNTNHIPEWEKNVTDGQNFKIEYKGDNEYVIHSLAIDPDGLGIEETKWSASAGTITEGDAKDYAVWISPGDNQVYTITARVRDTKLSHQPTAYSTKTAIIKPPNYNKSASALKGWSLAGITNDSFIQNLSESAVDSDSDGKNDSLIFQFDIDVSAIDTSDLIGLYNLSAVLSDGKGNMITAAEILFQGKNGIQTLFLPVDGMKLNGTQIDGPYELYGFMLDKITAYGSEQIAFDFSSYMTAAYQANDFESLYFGFGESATDTGVDDNENALYDVLKFSVPVHFDQPGSYLLQGQLTDNDSFNYGSSDLRVEIDQSTDTVMDLYFDGKKIYANGKDGRFILQNLTLRDLANPGAILGSENLQSASYFTSDFERPFITNIAIVSDQGEDHNQDGLYDSLAISCTMDVEYAGKYLMSASLMSGDTVFISSVQMNIQANAGNQDIILTFPGREISESNLDGPYVIPSIVLDNGYDERVTLDEEYVTGPYKISDFQLPPLILGKSFSESTDDNDSDGKIDQLLISFDVEIITDGRYEITGDLKDFQHRI